MLNIQRMFYIMLCKFVAINNLHLRRKPSKNDYCERTLELYSKRLNRTQQSLEANLGVLRKMDGPLKCITQCK